MNELQKLLTENLIEALRQIQSYLVLALGASLSAFALAFRPVDAADDKVTVPVFSLPLPRSAAHGILWVLTIIGGFMAGASAHRANVIAGNLESVPGLLGAVGTFPSVATLPEQIVRIILVFANPILAAFAVASQLRREKAPGTAMALMMFFVLVAYLPLWLELSRLTRLLGTP